MRRALKLVLPLALGFNPRICKRCDGFQILFSTTKISFNPRICKRCDTYRERLDSFNPVSIHASVKDATDRSFRALRKINVSIHASVKDATPRITATKGSE